MATEPVADSIVMPPTGGIDRRNVILRGAAGLSLGLIGTVLHGAAATAQDSTPAASDTTTPASPEGEQGMEHSSEHYALADDDAEAIWFLGTLALIKGVGSQTGGALSTVEFTHPPGFATPLHIHHTADEAFYVLAGAMQGVCGDQEWQATTGSFVWLPRGVPHGYTVDGEEPLRTLAIALPAGFERFVIEAGEPAQERALPPPAPPDVEKLVAVGTKYGIENVGPPVQFVGTPTA
jgi:mannose-6-phosphate isomerase-like protein (cupin superfamily)